MRVNLTKPSGCQHGIGLVLVLAIVAAVLVLVIVGFGSLVRARASARSICCNCNLKNVGLSARMWSNEHGDKFPWDVSMSSNGVKEFAMSGNVAALFRSLSNEMNFPKILVCPTDKQRKPAATFSKLTNTNISYFVGLDADERMPQTILTGDRNISGGVFLSNRVMVVRTTNILIFGSDLHGHRGNIGLGDGSAQQASDSGLQKQVTAHLQSFIEAGLEPKTRFALP